MPLTIVRLSQANDNEQQISEEDDEVDEAEVSGILDNLVSLGNLSHHQALGQ